MIHSSKVQKCPICGKSVFVKKFKARPLDYGMSEDFDIVFCDNCGHGMTEVFSPKDADLLYETGNYDIHENRFRQLIGSSLLILEENKVRMVRKWMRSGSIFEVGTGKGKFLQMAQEAGFIVNGIEPSKRSLSFAKRRLGSAVTSQTLHVYAGNTNVKHDAVCMWHVLEHLSDPKEALEDVKNILEDGGILMLAVPNFGSFQSNWGRANWYHLDPPRHLHHFLDQGLRRLLEDLGFEILEIFYGSFYQNWMGDLLTILNLVSPAKNAIINFLKSNKPFYEENGLVLSYGSLLWNLILLPILLVPTLAFTLASQLLKKSGTIVIFAKLDKGTFN